MVSFNFQDRCIWDEGGEDPPSLHLNRNSSVSSQNVLTASDYATAKYLHSIQNSVRGIPP